MTDFLFYAYKNICILIYIANHRVFTYLNICWFLNESTINVYCRIYSLLVCMPTEVDKYTNHRVPDETTLTLKTRTNHPKERFKNETKNMNNNKKQTHLKIEN